MLLVLFTSMNVISLLMHYASNFSLERIGTMLALRAAVTNDPLEHVVTSPNRGYTVVIQRRALVSDATHLHLARECLTFPGHCSKDTDRLKLDVGNPIVSGASTFLGDYCMILKLQFTIKVSIFIFPGCLNLDNVQSSVLPDGCLAPLAVPTLLYP